MLCCPECKEGKVNLTEKSAKKMGLSNLFVLKSGSCDFEHQFYTSTKKQNKTYNNFGVNTHVVYSMRCCGQGYSSLEKYCHLMNMPPPMTEKSYRKTSNQLHTVVKEIAENTFKDAAEELKESNGVASGELLDV